MLPVSVCMIAKNEEAYIEECLKRLSHYDWEIVVTDTGSSDHTRDIASRYTEHVYSFPWCDDFSAARNYCISKASRPWILNIDCDEYLTTACDGETLSSLLNSCMNCPEKAGMIEIQNPHAASVNHSISTDRVARFFHRDYYHFSGSVHEQPVPLDGTAPAYFHVPLSFYHIGYSQENILKKKAERNILLLKKELETEKGDPYLYYQLGQSYFVMGKTKEACQAFDQGLSFDVNPQAAYVQTMVESYGYCLLDLKQYEKALQFKNIYDDFSSRADFVFLMGLIYMNNTLFDAAVSEFLKATTITGHSVEGTNSYCALYNIGVIYECTGHSGKAREYYKRCGSYPPAKEALMRISHPG